jgi:serine protease inhibitor ecotin
MHALLDCNLRFLGGLATHTIGVDGWAFEKL